MHKGKRQKQSATNPDQVVATQEGPTNIRPTKRQARRRMYAQWRRGYYSAEHTIRNGGMSDEDDTWTRMERK